MSWLQKAASFVVRILNLQDPNAWRDVGAEASSGEHVNECSALSLSAVWACVNLLSGTIASLPLMVYRTGPDGSRTVAKDHPLYRILHDSPNADQTALDFWEFGCAAIELSGNMVARKDTIGSRLIGLTPVGVPVDVRRQSDGSLRYRWSEDGVSYDEPQENVFHVRGFGGNPLGGKSTLTFARETFGLAMATSRAASSTFKNGLRPSVVIGFKGFLKQEQRDKIEEGLARKYAGAMNDGKPFITEGDQTISTLSITPEDAQMLQSRGFSIEEICRFFGVPPFMIGHTEKTTSWGTGLSEQVLGFQKFTLRRRLKRIEQAIEKQLLSPADRAAGITVEFNVEGLLRADSKGRAEFYRAAIGDTQKPGWMLRSEVRALENLPPVPGWDQPIPLITHAAPADNSAPPAPPAALPAPEEA